MADFSKAYKFIEENEGGYANHPNDKGGETYAGITRKNYPNWPGWKYIDAAKKKTTKQGWKITSSPVPELVAAFYKDEYWDAKEIRSIKTQEVADFVLDWAVNSGTGIERVSKAVAPLGFPPIRYNRARLTADILNILNTKPEESYRILLATRKQFYLSLVAADRSQAQFLNNWMERLEKFPAKISAVSKDMLTQLLSWLGWHF